MKNHQFLIGALLLTSKNNNNKKKVNKNERKIKKWSLGNPVN